MPGTKYIVLAVLLSSSVFMYGGVLETADDKKSEKTDTTAADTVKKGFFRKVVDYFADIGGPHYSDDTTLGLGLVAAGLYRMDQADSLITPSNVSIYGDISTTGFYLLGVRGNNIFPKDKYRLNYNQKNNT